MNYLTIYPTSIDEKAIAQAVETLRDGGIVIYPTDTVYALGCDALNNRAIERLCAYKGINPARQHLSVVCSDISQAAEYARIDNKAFPLLKRNLPGPYTFILPASTKLPKVFKGRRTVGIRVPDNAIARLLAEALGNPILSASVKIDSSRPEEATNPESLEMNHQQIADLIIDGGEGGTHLSAVVDITDSSAPEIIREGNPLK